MIKQQDYENKMTELKKEIGNIMIDYFNIKAKLETYNISLVTYENKEKGIRIIFEIPKEYSSKNFINIMVFIKSNEAPMFYPVQREYKYRIDNNNDQILKEVRKIKAKLLLKGIFKSQ